MISILLLLLLLTPKAIAREIINANTGVTTSRGYPEDYPPDSDCTHRIFSMDPSMRVRVEFLEFDLYKQSDDVRDEDDCDILADDHIRIFDVIQDQRFHLRTVCGSSLPIPIMSAENQLILQFRSYKRAEPVLSKNLYKFRWQSNVTNFGINHAVQDDSKQCIFHYSSDRISEGKFTSPNYPGFYPRNTQCEYSFQGKPDEKILFAFSYFDVEGYSYCTSESLSDYIEFVEPGFRPFKFCADTRPGRIESTGNTMKVFFRSNEMFDGTGFVGQYRFLKKKPPILVKMFTSRANLEMHTKTSQDRIIRTSTSNPLIVSGVAGRQNAQEDVGSGSEETGSGSGSESGSGETVDPSKPNVHIIDS